MVGLLGRTEFGPVLVESAPARTVETLYGVGVLEEERDDFVGYWSTGCEEALCSVDYE